MMKTKSRAMGLGCATAVLALSGCGGGSGGTNFIPSPPVTPTPPPEPLIPPVPAGPIGLTGGPFTTYSSQLISGSRSSGVDVVRISYSADSGLYTFAAPGLEQGHLTDTHANGSITSDGTGWQSISSTTSSISKGDSATVQPGGVSLDWVQQPYAQSALTYTSMGSWSAADQGGGSFAYGIPTATGQVPVAGAASYGGTIRGDVSGSEDYGLWGTINLNFDFAAGTLTGEMKPETSDGWDPRALGTYTFKNTVFANGSTTFSGAFDVPDSTAASSFQGQFTGPGAVELMGNFNAPYLSPSSHDWQTMWGVFVGKKTP